MRAILFLLAFAIALLASAPLERWLLPLVREPLETAGIDLRVHGLRFALPAGIRADGIVLEGRGAGADVDSLYVGIARTFEAEACGGRISGRFNGQSLHVDVAGINPALCVRVGKLSLETTLSGSIDVEGVDVFAPHLDPGLGGRVELMAPSGVFRGILERAGPDGADLPLGEWEFNDLVLKASVSAGRLAIDEGRAITSGVQWEVLSAELPGNNARTGLRLAFRARAEQDGPRAKALLSLMPRATEDASGWRNYRVVGSLSAPRVVGVE